MSLIQKFSCGDVVENRYSLDIQVHEGRWGDIFRATDRLNDSPVAIRFFPNGDDGTADFERFSSHARELSGLTEPIIAKPVDHGMADEIPYVVYRWAKGQNLEAILAEQGKLKLADTLTIMAQILEGLDSAHQSRLTHGLLRPVKIIISGLDDGDPLVRLVDLQIWRFFEWSSGQKAFEASNLSRRIVRYLSPEVLEEHRVRPQSDLYSVGLIAIEMLTGKPAFDDNHRVALIAQQLSDEPAELSASAKAGPAFREFLAKLVAKDRSERFSSAAAALEALEAGRDEFLSEPTEPAPPKEEEPSEPALSEPSEEPVDEAPAPGDSQPIDDDNSKASEAVEAAQEFAPEEEFDPAAEADDELFGDDPSSMRSLSDGSSLSGDDDSPFGADDSPFDDELDFGDSQEILLDESARRGGIDGSTKAAGHSHRPEDGDAGADEDDEFDPAIADDIPLATGDDKRIQDVDEQVRGSFTDPSATTNRPRPRPQPRKDSNLSTPVTLVLSLALVAIIGGAAYFFIFDNDNGDVADGVAEAGELAEEVSTFMLTITTSPPAQTVLIEGRSRGISPMEVEVSEDELPLQVRARTDRENVHERIVTEPQSEIHFDLN